MQSVDPKTEKLSSHYLCSRKSDHKIDYAGLYTTAPFDSRKTKGIVPLVFAGGLTGIKALSPLRSTRGSPTHPSSRSGNVQPRNWMGKRGFLARGFPTLLPPFPFSSPLHLLAEKKGGRTSEFGNRLTSRQKFFTQALNINVKRWEPQSARGPKGQRGLCQAPT